jgi:DinB superfamily
LRLNAEDAEVAELTKVNSAVSDSVVLFDPLGLQKTSLPVQERIGIGNSHFTRKEEGPFQMPEGPITAEIRKERIRQIADAPAQMRAAVAGLTQDQMETPYRPGGWTVRQVAHHVPDSHMNAYIVSNWV